MENNACMALATKKLGGGGGGGGKIMQFFWSATLYSSSRSGYRVMYNPIQDNCHDLLVIRVSTK